MIGLIVPQTASTDHRFLRPASPSSSPPPPAQPRQRGPRLCPCLPEPTAAETSAFPRVIIRQGKRGISTSGQHADCTRTLRASTHRGRPTVVCGLIATLMTTDTDPHTLPVTASLAGGSAPRFPHSLLGRRPANRSRRLGRHRGKEAVPDRVMLRPGRHPQVAPPSTCPGSKASFIGGAIVDNPNQGEELLYGCHWSAE
jgi:hypothetical protein